MAKLTDAQMYKTTNQAAEYLKFIADKYYLDGVYSEADMKLYIKDTCKTLLKHLNKK